MSEVATRVCRKCGSPSDHPRQNICRPCLAAYVAAHYQASKTKEDRTCCKCGALSDIPGKNVCKACKSIYNAKWRSENAEHLKEKKAKHYLENRDQYNSASALWHKRNKEKAKINRDRWRKNNPDKATAAVHKHRSRYPHRVRESNAKWRKENPGSIRAKHARRRAHKLRATPIWADLKAIKEFYDNCPKGYDVDHIVPLQGENVCGLHVLNNLQYLPARMNRSKGNRWDESWLSTRSVDSATTHAT